MGRYGNLLKILFQPFLNRLLDYWRLGYLADHLTELAKNVNNRRICSASEVKKLLERYKQENKITPIQVKDKLRTSLKW
ncbi:hypothetical protein K210099B7_40190 [Bacteroides xylanisolvens]